MQTSTRTLNCRTSLINFGNTSLLKFKTGISQFSVKAIMFLLLFAGTMFPGKVKAQYSNVPVTGYNIDVVANGVGSVTSSTTGTFDNTQYTLAASNWNFNGSCAAISFFMPTSGTVNANSTVAPGLVYTLQSYSGLNDLRIPATGSLTTGTGTLNVITPVPMSSIYLLYGAGNGPITSGITVTVTFTDASTQVFSNLTGLDWFATTNPAISNVGRVDRTTTPACATTVTGGPQLFDLALPISPSNYTKSVQSIFINKTITTGTLNIMAVGMQAPCVVPANGPTALLQGATTTSSIQASWTAAASSPTGYLVVGYPTGATPVTPVTGTTYTAGQNIGTGKVIQANAATSATVSGLTGGTTYDIYVYSYNSGTTCGGPVYNTANVLSGTFSTNACAGLAGGTYKVGPTGDYLSLNAAITAISSGITGPIIFELQNTYNSAVETTLPIAFPSNPCVGAINSVTIRPEAGASGLSITSLNATGTINFNGAAYITIDGRAGGTGPSQLTISNTNAGASYAVQFMGDALNNNIKYCTITSRNTSTTSGTIVFGSGTASGNDNNTIDNCSILDGLSTPLNAIYSAGTSATVDNSGDAITNCNIANYYGAAAASNGIYLASNSAAWTITGNRFYQSSTRTATTGAIHRAIQIVTASGGGYTITGNTIGYGTDTGTGTTTYTGLTSQFIAINITAANSPVSSVQGNTVTNISVTSTTAGAAITPVFGGIVLGGGVFNVGTVTGNVIGATTGTGAIVVSGSTNGFFVDGIYASSTGNVNINNNSVGSINAAGNASGIGTQFYAIWTLGSGNFTINNNLVGSTATVNSIVAGTDLVTTVNTANMNFYGIRCDATGNITVGAPGAGNIIQNVALRSSGTAAFYGYYNGSAATSANYSYNILSNIAHGFTTTASSGIFYGFYNGSAVVGTLTTSNNNFQNLTNLNTTGAIYLIYSSSSTVTSVIQNNTYNNISRATTATSGTLYCYYNNGGPTGVQTFTGNTMTNIVAGATTGTTSFYGLYNNTSAAATWNVSNNLVSNITTGNGTTYGLYDNYGILSCFNNRVSNITTSGVIYGLFIGANVTTGGAVYLDTVNTLLSSGASSSIYGIYTTATTPTIYKNRVYDLSETGTSGTVYGIYTAGGTTIAIYNNLVGDLRATASSLTAPAPSVAGLYISSGTTINAYYNSINITGTGGTNFGTAAVYASTGSTVNLRNNIFSNTATPSGTGKTIAYQRSSSTLTSYATTSNNNLFYASIPGVNNLIYFDVSNSDQNIGSFKIRMSPRDQASVAENPPYLSTSGASASFLHINPATATQIESGGAAIGGFTDDYDGDTRNVSTPDIGADEFSGIAAVVVIINSVAITPAGNQCTPVSRTVTANITAGNSNITSVTLNYSFNGVAQSSITMTGGNPNAGQTSTWTGTIPSTGSGVAVVWSVSATDALTTKSTAGTGYTDDPLTGVTAAATASPSTPVCAGSNVLLTASLAKIGTQTLGAGASTTTTSGTSSGNNVSPFSHYFGGYKAQYIIKASELTALGFVTGNFTKLAFNVTTAGTTYNSFAINMANTASAVASATFLTGTFTQVFTGNYTPALGINDIVFSTPFNWDGTSNVLINLCWSNSNSGGVAAEVKYDATSFVAMAYYRADSQTPATICGQTAATGTQSNRPQMRLTANFAPAISSVTWSNGTSTVGAANPLTVNPTSNTTYTATVTSSGCTIVSSPVTVTVIALPAPPTPNNSTQCGTAVPQAFVGSGFSSGTVANFKWYDAQTGGSLIQTGGAYYLGSISTTTSFWVSETNATCESIRTELIATVNPPDAIHASSNIPSPCTNSTIVLTAADVATTPVNTYSYTWTAIPAGAASGLTVPTPGNPISVTPTVAGTYKYVARAVDGDCVTTDTVIITVKALPTINSTTATPAAICSGLSSTLSATSGTQGVGTVAIGAGASTFAGFVASGNEGFGNPFNYWYGNQKTQYIFTAAELAAQGLTAGNISALSFEVTAIGASYTMTGYTISIGNTSQSAAVATPITAGLTQVYTNAAQPITIGINNYVFSTAFNWNGTSNIVVSVCWGNSNSGVTASTATVKKDTAPFTSTTVLYTDGSIGTGICAATTASNNPTTTNRPRVVFTGITGVNNTGSMNWVWNPGALPGSTVTVSPTATTTYTVSATDPTTTCSATNTVTVTVYDLPPAPSGNGSEHCGSQVPTASVSSNSMATTPVFKWYTVPTGGTAVQTGTSTTYTSQVGTTTDFYVAEVSSQGCEGPRVQVTVSVITANPVSAASTPASVCYGGSLDLTATQTGDDNTYAFTWTANSASSGIAGSVVGNPITAITPTAVGTYTYTVTAFDVDKGCQAIATVDVLVKPVPVINSASASPATVCAGVSSTLTAVTGSSAQATVQVGSGTGTVGTLTTVGALYGGYYGNGHAQILIKASELTALNFLPGNLTALSIDISSLPSGAAVTTYNGYTIKIGAVSAATSSIATFQAPAFTTVYGPTNYTPVVGTNTHTFTTPFTWDGTSNIIVDYCFASGVFGSVGSPINTVTTTSFGSFVNYQVDNSAPTVCTITTVSNASSIRPNIKFTGLVGNSGAGAYSWTWNPGNLSGNVVTVTPLVTTTYTATATLNGCSTNSAPVTVTVNQLPNNPIATNSTQCGFGVPTASVATGGGGGNGVFNWYAAATGGTPLQSGVSTTYTTSISSTTTFYVSENGTNGCESPRTSVTATVTPPPAVSTAGSSTSVCLNNTATLKATSTENNYVYTWTATPGTGSGISGSLAGSAPGTSINTITPTLAGTYTYTVTATESINHCNTTATVVTAVNPNPIVTNVSANPTTVCSGGSSVLTGQPQFANVPVTGFNIDIVANGTGAVSASTTGDFDNLWTLASPDWNFSGSCAALAYALPASGLIPANSTVASGLVYALKPYAGLNDLRIPATGTGTTGTGTLTLATPTNMNTVYLLYGAGNGPITSGITVTVTFTDASTQVFSNLTAIDWFTSTNAAIGNIGRVNRTTTPACVTTVSGGPYLFDMALALDAANYPKYVQSIKIDKTVTTGIMNVLAVGMQTPTQSGIINWQWNPGPLVGNTVTVNPTVTTSYTATATNQTTGCTSTSAPVTVTVTPVLASASANPSVPVCSGTAVTLNGNPTGGAPFTYSWSNGTSVVGTTNPLTVNPTTTTTYTVTVKDACNNTTTSSVTVTVNPLPTVSVTPATATFCNPGAGVALNASGAVTYAWTPAAGLSASTGASVTASPTTGTTYTVTGTDGNGCINTATSVISVSATPTATATASPTTLCAGSPLSLTSTGSIPATGYTVGSVPVAAETPSGTPTVLASGGTTVTPFTAGNTATLDDVYWDNIALPFSFSFYGTSYNAVRISSNGNVQFGALSAGTGTTGNYTWVPQTIPTAGGNLDNFIAGPWIDQDLGTTPFGTLRYFVNGVAPNRKFVISYEAVHVYLSSDNNTSQIILNENGTVDVLLLGAGFTATANKVIGVENANGTLGTAAPGRNLGTWTTSVDEAWRFTPVVGNFSYAWTGPNSFTSAVQNPVISSPDVSASGIYHVVVTNNASGCSSLTANTATVTVNPRPTGVLSGSGTYCNGANTATSLSISVTGAGPWTGTITDGTTTTPFSGSTSPISVTVTPAAASTTYTIATLNGSACSSIAADLSGSATVTINPRPTGVISGSGTYCNGANTATALSIAVTGAGPWSGTLSDGTPFSGSTSPISVTVTPTATTTYTIATLNGSACSSIAADFSGSATVTVNPRPTGIISGSGIYCNGANTATVLSIAVTGAGLWSGTLSNGATFSGSTSPISVTVTPTATTTYTIATLNGSACSSVAADLTGSATVTINPRPTGVISGSGTYCANQSTTTSLSISVTGAGPWSGTITDGTTSTPFSGSTSPISVSVTPTATSTYTIATLNGSACSSIAADLSGSATVTVNPQPATPTITAGGPATFCSGGSVVLTSSSATGNQWNLNGTAIAGQTNQTLTVTASGDYTVTVSNGFGCSATSLVTTVTVNPTPATPTITAGGPTTFCQGGSVVLTSSSATGNQWSLNGTAIAGQTNQTLTVTASGNYTVTVTAGSCSATSAATSVTVNPLAANATANVTQPTCSVGTGTITVTSPLGAGITYSLDGGAYQGSVTFSAVAPGMHTLTAKTSSGCFSPASTSVTVNPQPFTPSAPMLSGIVSVCPYLGTGQQLTYTAAAPGATGFNWLLPPNVNLVSGQGTSSIVVTLGTGLSGQANKQLRVTATSTCGTSPLAILYLLTEAPHTPDPITGPVNLCPLIGTGTVATYIIPSALSATRYTWIVPANTTVTHPNIVNPADSIYDTVINVVYNAGFQTGQPVSISAIARNGCGLSGTRTIQLSAQPAGVPGLINGPTNVCANILPGGTAATYSVAAMSGVTSYSWTTPSGTTVTHPNGIGTANDYTITVLYPAGFTSGTITVTATNGCGMGSPRSLSITKLNPATPGNIDVIQTHFCGEPGGRVFTYTISAMPANATSILWTIPTTGAMLVSGQGSTSITVSYTDGAVNSSVTAQAQNNCANSTIRSVLVKLPACPVGFAGGGKVESRTTAAEQPGMEVRIFPNPTVSDFKLEVLSRSAEQIDVRVIDIQGKLYKSFRVAANQVIALGAELKSGSYLVEVRQGTELKTTKVVKF